MVIQMYMSRISGNNETKKRQQRACLIMDSCRIDYALKDITEPGHQDDLDFIHKTCKVREGSSVPLSPQFFNDLNYCGDWDDFMEAVESNKVHEFLGLEEVKETPRTEIISDFAENEVTPETMSSPNEDVADATTMAETGITVETIKSKDEDVEEEADEEKVEKVEETKGAAVIKETNQVEEEEEEEEDEEEDEDEGEEE